MTIETLKPIMSGLVPLMIYREHKSDLAELIYINEAGEVLDYIMVQGKAANGMRPIIGGGHQ